MLNAFRGTRPDITPAQLTAIVAALTQCLRAFGIFDVTPEQQDALNVASGLLLAVVLGDVGIRAARNSADAKTQAAALQAPMPPLVDVDGIDPEHELLMAAGEDLPTDEEEFAASVPVDQAAPVQPSQAGLTDTA